ncbi:leucine-rich repeat domain-containing protein [Chryseomicrobium palamuruense]|uniref:Leucine-rich repeat domain-containing protein n=1 Tax=Chryseomicrobium palamuruense TaxID=682973 RepID=A0ABV8USI3_9BACL
MRVDLPRNLFDLEKRPAFTKDLKSVRTDIEDLVIQGETKNLDLLSTFTNLTKLWIYTVNQQQFENIISLIQPKQLHIYEMRVSDLSPLESLHNLEVVSLQWNTKATSLWDLGQNPKLYSLAIMDFPKLQSLDALQTQPDIHVLELHGGIWNSLTIPTLEPLRKLVNLRHLTLMNIRVKDESLEPIADLHQLEELSISNQFPTQEYARLSVKLANANCELFHPYILLESPIEDKDIMVVGK